MFIYPLLYCVQGLTGVFAVFSALLAGGIGVRISGLGHILPWSSRRHELVRVGGCLIAPRGPFTTM